MILQTGQRTDIPAFYGQWFINRVKAGIVDVRNPYDPIIINHKYSIDFHCETFYKMAKSLEGYTDTVVASFLDMYDKVLRNFPEGKRPPQDVQIKLMKQLIRIANQFGMTLKTCGEGDTFKHIGADTSGCLTIDCYERAWNVKLRVPKKVPARPECNC